MPINGNAQAGVGGAGRKGIPLQDQNSAISNEQQAAGISNAKFLSAIFRQGDTCWITKFRENPATAPGSCWGGQSCSPEEVNDDPGSNAYFSVASFKPGAERRAYENFAGLGILALDDPENVSLAPSWLLQTSSDKYQAGYRLTEPVTDIEIAKRLHKQLAEAGHLPVDRNGNNPIRYVRLPVGANTKHDPPFPCVLKTFDPELIYTLDELIEGLGLDATYIFDGEQQRQKAVPELGDIITEGSRNTTLASLAGSMRRRGMSQAAIEAALLVENKSRCSPPLPEGDITVIARSISRYSPSDVPQNAAVPAVEINFEIKPLTLEILRAPIATREFAIEPLLPRGVLAEFSGAHGISKSTLALDMALSIAAGRQWCGLPTAAGKVVFASREDSRDEILRRVQGWLAALPASDRTAAEKAICENLILLGRDETTGLAVTIKEYGKCSVRREAIELIAERSQGAVLVVLETASRLHGGDELNEDLAQLAEAFEQIASRTGAAVMLIRHVSKESARNKSVDSYAGRGGGALSDAARSVLVLVQLTPEQAREQGIALDGLAAAVGSPVIALNHAKSSYSAPHEPLFFMRLPGPRLQPVVPPNPQEVFGERLLRYMREESKKGIELTVRQMKGDCKLHNVPQRQIEGVLHVLELTGCVRGEAVKRKGGTHTVWVPVS